MTARRSLLIVAGVSVGVGVSVGLWLFQPWKLWVDDKVEEAAPAGAREIAVGDAPTTVSATTVTPTAAPAATEAPTTVAPTTVVPATVPATVTPTTVASTTVASTTAAPVGSSFVGIDHGTSGTLVLLQDDAGRRFVRFENLDTSNGPDLFVYLSTNPVDGPEGAFDDDYVNLGRLQGNVGSQNYEIPADVDLSAFASVVIWCDRFNSAFGAAPLA